MSKRTVTLKLTTQRDLVKHESSARTFAELKKELSNISFNGMKVIERTKKVTLEADDAVLPATDFMLFLVPQKVKSGAVEHLDDIDAASYNELRSHGSYLNSVKNANLNLSGGTQDLRDTIADYYKGQTDEVDESVVIIEEARASVNQVFDNLIFVLQNRGDDPDVEEDDIVIKTTMQDLDNEIAEIRKQFKL